MEHRKNGDGLQTFLEHWSWFLVGVMAFGISRLFSFFTNLDGGCWIGGFIAAAALLLCGAALIVSAKIPVYRSGRFFTFGIKSVPANLAGCYRWGWRVFATGVGLSLCLLLSHH